jgi:nucleoside-diphosphate-sugar epimerase
MKVAVTGGSGKIGSELCKQLVAKGHQVINLDRRTPHEAAGRWVYADLCQRAQVQPILEQCEMLCHLGEIPTNYLGFGQEHVYAHNTAAGSCVLQTAADLKLQRIIYTSSCQVYGCFGRPVIAPERLPIDETHPLRPQQGYATSKVANEFYARMVSERTGASIAILRFPFVWPISKDNLDETLKRFERYGLPSTDLASYVSTTDAAHAYILALENPRPGCEAYHFSAAEILSHLPLKEWMRQHFPTAPTLPADWPAFKSPLSTDKARAHFGWEPQCNITELCRQKLGRGPK